MKINHHYTEYILLLMFGCVLQTSGLEWTYSGKNGISTWPKGCDGMKQSPIDIITNKTTYDKSLTEIKIWSDEPMNKTRMKLKNDGNKVEVTVDGDQYVTGGGLPKVYLVAGYHFHWGGADNRGSEHLVDSKAAPLELHIVCFDFKTWNTIEDAMVEPQGLAVLGIQFEITESDNVELQPVVENLHLVADPNTGGPVEISVVDLHNFLPSESRHYYRYSGSLTTPPCSESVIWTLFQQKVPISPAQLEKFRKLQDKDGQPLIDNYRPPQELNGRKIYTSFIRDGASPSDASSLTAICPTLIFSYVLAYYYTIVDGAYQTL